MRIGSKRLIQQNAVQIPHKRRVENLSRTGIEYPVMKQTYKFIQAVPSEEPLSDTTCSQMLLDEYIMNDAEHTNNNTGTVVYDSIDTSPFYENELYIDESLLIELPPV
jgi:hypothetical protein